MDLKEFIVNGINDLGEKISIKEQELQQMIGAQFALRQMLQATEDGVFAPDEEPSIPIEELLQKAAAGEDLLPENVTPIRKKRVKKNGDEEGGDGEVS